MKARNYGRIVNISSVAGKEGNPNALALFRRQGRRHRPDQVARQGTRQIRYRGERHDPGDRQDQHPRQLHRNSSTTCWSASRAAVSSKSRRLPPWSPGWSARRTALPPPRSSISRAAGRRLGRPAKVVFRFCISGRDQNLTQPASAAAATAARFRCPTGAAAAHAVGVADGPVYGRSTH